MKRETPSIDLWLKEAKMHENAGKVGMYLTHSGVVRQSARAFAREGKANIRPVKAMLFSYDRDKVDKAVSTVWEMPGIYYVRVWLNEGELNLGEDIMLVLIGGDIRPNVVEALQYLVGRLKEECVTETEIY